MTELEYPNAEDTMKSVLCLNWQNNSENLNNEKMYVICY